jgi:hypothetical protein
MDHEKKLRKLATKGVVQLFNALRAAQKSAQEVASEGIQKNTDSVPLITKHVFLKSLSQTSCTSKKIESGRDVAPFLRDDFMTCKAVKHWDEEEEEIDETI